MTIITKGATNQSVYLRIVDATDGTPETGVVWNTSGIDLWYFRPGAVHTSITEATTTEGAAHTDGGFVHISDGNYKLDVPDAAFATGVDHVIIGGTVTGMVVISERVELIDVDLRDAVRAGMTALPNAAADAAGGLIVSDAGGLDADAQAASVTAIELDTSTTLQAELDGIQADTEDIQTQIGTAGAGLTDLGGMSTAMKAEVNAEADTALTDYDAATGAEVAALNDPTAAAIADAVLDEALSGHVVAGSLGKAVADIETDATAILDDTDLIDDGTSGLAKIATDVAAVLVDTATLGAPAGASHAADIAAIKAETANIVADTNELQTDDVPGLIAALNDLSAAAVNAEVVDVMSTDTFAEPTGVPAATAALATKIGYLYMALRNRVDITATKKTFYDDGGTGEWEKDLSDDATTYSESEANTI